MNPKKLKKLRRQLKKAQTTQSSDRYLRQLTNYRNLFKDYGSIVFLINQVLESERLIRQNLLPQQLPLLELPDDVQEQIFNRLKERFPLGDPRGSSLGKINSRTTQVR